MTLEAWLVLLEQRHPQNIELGLERCGTVYRRLGSPRPASKVFTVAGTNGKGSTVAYLAAMSGSLGQRFGTYTSPHIFHFNERICIMGEPVSDDCLIRAFEQVELARGEVSLTYFEFTTLAGLLILQQSELDCAILEVGLGGRLDTVNLVDTDCAVITPIGLDHQEYLGADLFSIATEKAGIIRRGKPVVCTEESPPGPIFQISESLQAPLYRRGIDFDLVCNTKTDSSLPRFLMAGIDVSVPGPSMGGRHQQDNFAAALAALVLLNPDCFTKSSRISGQIPAEILAAIENCRVPGRLQRVHSSPEILLDVGHNELAAEAVAAYLADNNRSNTTCVVAMLADKSAEAVAHALGKVCKRWLCADSPGERGQSGESLARRLRISLPTASVSAFKSLDESMQEAVSSVLEDETILVFGSFITVSAAASWLQHNMKNDGKSDGHAA
ncbi:MAG: bifunctional folylpolyglutamate synthase/dihydrofolate synthase [Gammaproteobacteria bacterium]|nr:bifunctional folylpolyglutamate synthase/dihydrofolate synthase [Gammaproteobacteria bacterium]